MTAIPGSLSGLPFCFGPHASGIGLETESGINPPTLLKACSKRYNSDKTK
jgi:hypothetical protein